MSGVQYGFEWKTLGGSMKYGGQEVGKLKFAWFLTGE
jgi:hypothetical protein